MSPVLSYLPVCGKTLKVKAVTGLQPCPLLLNSDVKPLPLNYEATGA